MIVNAKIVGVETINTDTADRANQPIVEFTLEVTQKESELAKDSGAGKIKFTEMLSNLADMDDIRLTEYMTAIIEDYVRTVIKGQETLDAEKKWVDASKLLNTNYQYTL